MAELTPSQFEALFSGAVFEHELERLAARTPYTRRGYPDYLLFTPEQWEQYDAFHACNDEMDRKHGASAARSRRCGRPGPPDLVRGLPR